MRIHSNRRAALLGLACCAAGMLTAEAASTIVTFSVDMATNIANGTFIPGTDTVSVHGTFDGWGAGVNLAQQGSTTIYTNTINDTTDPNGGVVLYKFVNSNPAFSGSGGYENLCDGGGNRGAILPEASGSSLVLPTPFFGDSGTLLTYTSTITFQVDMSQQINLGAFAKGVDTVTAAGNFNGWNTTASVLTNDPSILITNEPSGVVTSNVYVGTFTSVPVSTNAHMAYKYLVNGNYGDNPSGTNNDGGGNRWFTMLPTDQTLPFVDYADQPYAPIASNITFSVDMTVVQLTDTNFNPNSLTINGSMTGWGGVAMTNDPSAANTNIYYCTQSFASGIGSTLQYQYRYTLLSDPGTTVYDHLNGASGGGGNRIYTVADVPSTNILSVFNDASLNDYLLQPTPVFFSVNMTNAVGFGDGHVFDPSVDSVYINGQFANWYSWASGITPAPAPPGYQMIEEGTSLVYTNTIVMPAGTPVGFAYKYGIDINSLNGGPADDEAASGSNHVGVVRSAAFNPYVMPRDTFGNQYAQPFFNASSPGGANLTIGPASNGTVPVTWLGRPGAHLQVKSDLTSGAWQDHFETDGTNWTIGFNNPTNGFVSQTNWPAGSGNLFFRLVKP